MYLSGPGANLADCFSADADAAPTLSVTSSQPEESESDITIGIGFAPLLGNEVGEALAEALALILSLILFVIASIVGLDLEAAGVCGIISLAHISRHLVRTFCQYFLAADGDRAHSCWSHRAPLFGYMSFSADIIAGCIFLVCGLSHLLTLAISSFIKSTQIANVMFPTPGRKPPSRYAHTIDSRDSCSAGGFSGILIAFSGDGGSSSSRPVAEAAGASSGDFGAWDLVGRGASGDNFLFGGCAVTRLHSSAASATSLIDLSPLSRGRFFFVAVSSASRAASFLLNSFKVLFTDSSCFSLSASFDAISPEAEPGSDGVIVDQEVRSEGADDDVSLPARRRLNWDSNLHWLNEIS